MTKLRRAACVWLTGIMAATFVAGNVLAFADTKGSGTIAAEKYDTVNFTDVTGKVDVSSVALQNLSPSVLQNAGYTTASGTRTVIVRLNSDSVADSVPDGESVTDYLSSYAGSKKIKSIKEAQNDFLNSLSSMGVSYKLRYQYTTVTNAVAIEVDASQISAIKSVASVKAAYLSQTYSYPEAVSADDVVASTPSNYSNVYATGIYNSSDIIDEYGYDGSGMTVAVLDTGLDYTHEAFTTYMPDSSEVAMDKSYVASKLNENVFNATTLSAANGKNITADDVYVSLKVPFAYDYADGDADVYPSYSQHGTHVAGIVAGHADSYKDKDGNLVKSEFKGVAPNAQLVICKVFTDDFESDELGGATTENLVAALEDCVSLGVDVINMSLGTPSGFSSGFLDDDDEGQLLDDCYRAVKGAGISLICAASNEYSAGFGSAFGTNLATNPDSGTVGSPSTFDGAVSVASVNGQQAPFMVANADTNYAAPIFYTESSDANAVRFEFAKQLLGNNTSEIFKYVVVPGAGQESNYSASVKALLNDSQYRTIALVRRGTTTFEAKIRTAMQYADAIIVYNNVAGSIGMSVGEIEDPIPAVSITMDAGTKLCYNESGKPITHGYIEINSNYLAGPFMNEYSSWGATPDLKLKPDVTAHGGEITSTVAGGYDELSGTSMASPNLAGFVALLRSYVKKDLAAIHGGDSLKITQLVNQLVMSTATTVYDVYGLPYSPRKQGSGLATLKNAFGTGAYLWTDEENDKYAAEDNRPKVELGEDEDGVGKYTFSLNVTNFGANDLEFIASAQLFTETLSTDRLSVAEKAYFLNDIAPVWSISENGASRSLGAGEVFAVKAGSSAKITVTLELSQAEKNYITTSFPNGMFVEGFITLKSQTEGQCDLNLPYMGFYGDWEAAPMLDYSVYEIAESQQDKSTPEEQKLKESVWATQAFANYYDNRYSVPMGSYAYTQDESAEQIYADAEHAAISRYNWYYGDDDPSNYLTTYQIRALYAGLLRNAAVVTYDLSDAETGELIKSDNVYRLNKAYAGGGASTPSQVLLEFDPEVLGLVNNGKYALDFYFYFNVEQYEQGIKTEDNTFSMTFYVDYEAPILLDSRIRYVDHKDTSGREWQSVYLDLDIYDNTYAQSVILCCAEYNDPGNPTTLTDLRLVTDYITPVYNSVKNGTTTVTIDITDLMAQPETYKNRLYAQIDDYALNHRVFQIDFARSTANVLPSEFEIIGNTDIVVGVNETYKVNLQIQGSANPSNFTWTTSSERYVRVYNGEIFGVAPTRANIPATVTVIGANGVSKSINVTVVDNGKKLTFPTALSFGMIRDNLDSLVKATGVVRVNAGVTFTLDLIAEPWYYNLSNYTVVWSSSNTDIAEVDQNGNVTVHNTKGNASIYAEIYDGSIPRCAASVTLAVQDPYTVSNNRLTRYSGTEKIVEIPNDKNILTIGEEAFEDNSTMEVLIIPSTVTSIDIRAFVNCTALREVYFIQKDAMEIPDSSLTTIMRYAFSGCTALEKVDLSNCKTITVDRSAFEGCTSLKTIVKMDNIGTMNSRAFYGCTSLESIDLTGMHVAGSYVFAGCTKLTDVKTGYYTAIGTNMFNGCTSLREITINTKTVEANAFSGCTNLETVTFGKSETEQVSDTYIISDYAFYNCVKLATVDFNGKEVSEIGDMAFANCSALTSFAVPAGLTRFGDRVFDGVTVSFAAANGSGYTVENGAVYNGTTLLIAPKSIPSGFALKSGTTAIAPYAFSGSVFASGTINLSGVTLIGVGAFANSNLGSVTIPATVTDISAYAFTGTRLTTVKINKEVKSIGAGAFMNCANLATVDFEENSQLASIGDAAFYRCTALKTVTLPDGVKTMGSSVFYGCNALTSAVMPSVTSLGAYTFVGCTSLERVTFGENATTVGDYTFGSTVLTDDTLSVIGCAKLTEVVIGGKTKVIGEGAFMGCTALEEIDLKNVTDISNGAFYGCRALKNTDLSKIEHFGNMAFYGCSGLTELNLTNAKTIGDGAFYLVEFESLSIPVAESIGSFAFFGGLETTVEIPTSVRTIGYGAFANSANLTAFAITGDGATKFFVENGVLYRILDTVSGREDSFELTAYPTAKVADTDEENTKTYSIKEGTATVKAYAMASLADGAVEKVILPYSVKTIGDAAFFESGITHYQFESINAPVLLSEFYYIGEYSGEDLSDFSHWVPFARNFGSKEVWNYVSSVLVAPQKSDLKISYPSNGSGYDNYIYRSYFGFSAELGELMDDTTRALINAVNSFPTLEEIASWSSLEVNESNKTMVSEFSALVISAHELYNILASDYQFELFGEENEQRLFAVENALKSVKAHFGIAVTPKSFSISNASTHKSVYTEGERFSLNGLVLIVNYDDYSTELADMSKVILEAYYDRELTTLSKNVYVAGTGEYTGLRIMIPITVNEAGGGNEEEAGNPNGLVIGLSVAGGVLGLIIIAAVVFMILELKFGIKVFGVAVFGKIFKKTEKTEVVSDEEINGTDAEDGGNKEE
ncbi:MAG: leucine-rich repeat protein [Clostridia bacterium]|nr:leucine-rich repeat protein [Clostridia bacterium]